MLHKDDLFLLCCLWDCPAPLKSLYSDNLGLAFNIPYAPGDMTFSLDRLRERKFLKIEKWKSAGGRDVVGLTKTGGEYFEDYFQINWKTYITSPQKRCFGRKFGVNVANEEMVEKLRGWLSHRIGDKIFRADIEHATKLTYWKRVDCLRVVFSFDLTYPDEMVYEMFDVNYAEFDSQLAKKFKSTFKN